MGGIGTAPLGAIYGEIELAFKSLQAGTAGQYDAWSRTHNRTLPTTAVTLAISSSSANDASPSGTGARKIRVYGLDANYTPIYEDFTLNGQNKVTGTQYFFRVQPRIDILEAGSGGVNVGDIYVYDSSDTPSGGVPPTSSKIFGIVGAGDGNCQMGMITVPAGHRAILKGFWASTQATASHFAAYNLKLVSPTGLTQLIQLGSVSTTGANWIVYDFDPPIELPEKWEIVVQCRPSAVSIVNAGFLKMAIVPTKRGA